MTVPMDISRPIPSTFLVSLPIPGRVLSTYQLPGRVSYVVPIPVLSDSTVNLPACTRQRKKDIPERTQDHAVADGKGGAESQL